MRHLSNLRSLFLVPLEAFRGVIVQFGYDVVDTKSNYFLCDIVETVLRHWMVRSYTHIWTDLGLCHERYDIHDRSGLFTLVVDIVAHRRRRCDAAVPTSCLNRPSLVHAC